MVSMDDTLECEDIVKADSRVRRMLAERYGITDMASIAADPWYYGDRTGAQNSQPIPRWMLWTHYQGAPLAWTYSHRICWALAPE